MTTLRIGQKLEVEVSDRHIEEGQQEDCMECPIALALKDMFQEHSDVRVYVSPTTTDFFIGDNSYILIGERDVYFFVREFDMGIVPAPQKVHFKVESANGYMSQ